MSKQNMFFLFFFIPFSLSCFKPIGAVGDLSTALSLLKCKLLSLATSLSGEKKEIKLEEKKLEMGNASKWKEGSETGGTLSFIAEAWKNFDVNKYSFAENFFLPGIDKNMQTLLNAKKSIERKKAKIIDFDFFGPLYLYKSVLIFDPLYQKDIKDDIDFKNIGSENITVVGIKISGTKELVVLSVRERLWNLVKTIGYGGLIKFYSGFEEKKSSSFSDYYNFENNQGYDMRKQDKDDESGGTIFKKVNHIPLPASVKSDVTKKTTETQYSMLYPYPECVLSGLSTWGAEYRDFFQKKFTDYAKTCLSPKEKLTYVSVGSGRLLQDIVLIQSFLDAGISFKNFVFIDELYGAQKETSTYFLKNSLGTIRDFLGMKTKFESNDNIFEYFGKYDENDKEKPYSFFPSIENYILCWAGLQNCNNPLGPGFKNMFLGLELFKEKYNEKNYSLKTRIDLAIKSILNLTMYDYHKEFYFFAQWFKEQLGNEGGIYIFDNSDSFNEYCEKDQSIKPDVLVFVDVHLKNKERFSAIEKKLTENGIFAFFENSLIGGGKYEFTNKWLPGFVLGQNGRNDFHIYWFNDMKWFYKKDDRSSGNVKFYNSMYN